MKTRIKILNRFLGVCCAFLAVSALLGGCERSYVWYDIEQKDGLRFLGDYDTAYVSTKSNGEKWVSYETRMDIIGFTRDVDRRFRVEIVDSLTTISPDSLRFQDTCYIPAGEVFGFLRFSYAYSETDTVSVGFRIVENDDFRPVMGSQVCFILYPYKMSAPFWWQMGTLYESHMFGSEWSPRLNELFFQYYHAVEQTEPYVWTTFFEPELGRDFENIVKGRHYDYSYMWGIGWSFYWLEPYLTLLRKYVARPLYDHLKEHPEDGDFNNMPDPYL